MFYYRLIEGNTYSTDKPPQHIFLESFMDIAQANGTYYFHQKPFLQFHLVPQLFTQHDPVPNPVEMALGQMI